MWQGFFEILAQQIGYLLFGLDPETVWSAESWVTVDWTSVSGVEVSALATNFTILISIGVTLFCGWLVLKFVIWLFSLTKIR